MSRSYELNADFAKASADLAERIALVTAGTRSVDEISALLSETEEIVARSRADRPGDWWTCWLAAARYFVAATALKSAVRSGTGVADAKARLDILQCEFVAAASIVMPAEVVKDQQHITDELIAKVMHRPLPVLYWHRIQSGQRSRKEQPEESSTDDAATDGPLPTVARLLVHIDNSPLVSPQEVRPGTLYRIRLEAHFAVVPPRVTGLQFHVTTTLAGSQYTLSPFRANGPNASGEQSHVVCATGMLAFPYAQNDPFSPIVFAVSAVLLIGEERFPIRVVGHDQLHFRVRDDSRTFLSSGWPRMDSHVHDLVQDLCSKQPAVRDELAVLLPLLDALTGVLGTFAQGGVLKGRTAVGEGEFQAEVLKLLRMKLGDQVQEGLKQAGGITDIRFRGCIIELKVEDAIADREKVFRKYTSQATQYQGVEARSIAILLVLDLTEKTEPPGDLRNDIRLGKVETHGGSGTHPSWAFMFVVRGNVKSPSSYST